MPRSARRSPPPASPKTDMIEMHDTNLARAAPRVCRVPVRPPAAQGLPAARLPAPRQQRPQRIRRLHGGARPRRRHGDGRHAQLEHGLRGCAQGARCQAAPARDRRVDRADPRARGAGCRRQPCTTCRTPSSSPTSPRRRGAWRDGSAWSRALPSLPTPPSASRAASARTGCARPCPSSTAARSTSSTTATWRPTWRSTARP